MELKMTTVTRKKWIYYSLNNVLSARHLILSYLIAYTQRQLYAHAHLIYTGSC